MGLPHARDFVRRHDQPFRSAAAGPGQGLRGRQFGRAAGPSIPGRVRQISFSSPRRQRRGDGLHTGARPGHPVRLDAGGLRPGLYLLRHGAHGTEAQPHPGGDRGPDPGSAAPLPGREANLEPGLHGHGRAVGPTTTPPAGRWTSSPTRPAAWVLRPGRSPSPPWLAAADAPAHGGDPGQSGHLAPFGAGCGAFRVDAVNRKYSVAQLLDCCRSLPCRGASGSPSSTC